MDWLIPERAEPKVTRYVDPCLLDVQTYGSFDEPWGLDREAFRELLRQCIDVAGPDDLGIFLIDCLRKLLPLVFRTA